MSAPFFTVIVTTHRRPALLRRALGSLRAQTFPDHAIVLVDDAGCAETAQVASELLRPQDTFVRRSGPPGPAASRNLGMDLAHGIRSEWVLFLDDDDAFAPHHLATLHAATRASPAPVRFCDCTVITEDRSQPGVPELSRQFISLEHGDVQALWIKNFIPPHALAYRRDVLEGLRVDTHMQSLEDWEFLLAVAERAPPLHYAGGGAIQHVDPVNRGNRRSTTEAATNSLVVLEYIYTYRRRPAPSPAIRARRRELLKGVGMDLPAEWF